MKREKKTERAMRFFCQEKQKSEVALFFILCLISFHLPSAEAQELNIFGYLEPQMMIVRQNKKWVQMSSNRLRVETRSVLNEQVSFGGNVIFLTYHGQTNWNFLDYLPSHLTKQIPAALQSGFAYTYQDSIFLDNAFLKIRFEQFDLTIGKQQLSFGTGYAWNPTNLFNVKNLTDPTYEQPGHNAIRADIGLTERSSLTAIVQLEEFLRRSAAFLRWTFPLSRLDFSLIAAQKYWALSDYEVFDFSTQKRQMLGFDFAGELLGLGVWGEFGHNFMARDENFTEILVGTDYTWDGGFYLMAEFYHNSLAKSNWQSYTLTDWIRYLNGELLTVTKNQAYVFLSYPLTDLLTASLSNILSLSDKSAGFVSSVRYSLFENLMLTVIGQIYTGREGTAYGKNFGDGGLVRLRLFY
ncbi:hypothetical protein Ctha_0154 [Chloroherpeton thalassium ATCC 35110]|uniref:Alginate export domain-containing protein n=1 Tax=Chloroherpeton thalassium (strain ATCC 35110 / GB-78) TaxID=517418 RepID=B3QSY2_CHLT3|nr:hypothetical protein [Chloroherpeton thalassium]ACF12625.1 hypothetical protein Ctha_0154 [Chloroherpeton thalassium ATCC 35110]